MAIDWDRELLGPVMAVFGEPVIYTPRGSASFRIEDAVFDEEAADVQVGEDGQISSQRKPMLGVRAAAFASPPLQSDRVVIERTGAAYIVRDAQADGHGWIVLDLMVASL